MGLTGMAERYTLSFKVLNVQWPAFHAEALRIQIFPINSNEG